MTSCSGTSDIMPFRMPFHPFPYSGPLDLLSMMQSGGNGTLFRYIHETSFIDCRNQSTNGTTPSLATW